MKLKSLIVPLVNLVVFVGAGLALYELGRKPLADKPAPEADDLPLNIHTDVPVHVGVIQKLTLQKELMAYGQVEPAPAGYDQAGALARVSAPKILPVGSLQSVEGQQVNKGDVLFTQEDKPLEARVQAEQQMIDGWEASAARSDVWAGMQTAALALAKLDLARAKTEREMLAVRSPIAGVVSAIHINVGEMAGPATVAVEVLDRDRLVAALDVPAVDAAVIKVGAAASIQPTPSPTTRPWITEVAYVDPVVDSSTGMASVDVPLPPQSGYLSGQFISAQIVVEQAADCLAVPAASIIRNETGEAFIALVGPDRHSARLQPVTVGIRDGDRVQVQGQDLEAGQTIVTTGAAALVNRTGIHVVEP